MLAKLLRVHSSDRDCGEGNVLDVVFAICASAIEAEGARPRDDIGDREPACWPAGLRTGRETAGFRPDVDDRVVAARE